MSSRPPGRSSASKDQGKVERKIARLDHLIAMSRLRKDRHAVAELTRLRDLAAADLATLLANRAK